MTWLDELDEVETSREVNPFGGSNELEGRDGACTPKWLADLLPTYDVDPCSNSRSNIRARLRLSRENGGDGLAVNVQSSMSAFINPPYARGQVLRWVELWRKADFTFLLRWDPSTEWFSKLWRHCWGSWFPFRRMNFEPPPGVKFSSNPFPHALFFRTKPTGKTCDGLYNSGYFVARA